MKHDRDVLYPPRWFFFGSLLVLVVTLEVCYGSERQTLSQVPPGAPALLRAISDMNHHEGLALAISLIHILE